jgi:hypothetical protein
MYEPCVPEAVKLIDVKTQTPLERLTSPVFRILKAYKKNDEK